MFDPKPNNYKYPEDTSGHYAEVHKDRGIVFDKNYPYVDYSKGFAFKRFWVRFLLRTMVFPWSHVKMGIKIKGKKNLKKNKTLLKLGAVTVCNHVHRWDYICIMKAIHRIHWPYILVWNKNVNGESGPLVRMVGGIPIPLDDKEATVAFSKATRKILNDGGFLHFYAEGSMWEYYRPIRPFKCGAASYAVKCDKPILPMAFSYRKPNWFRRKIMRQIALFTLNIGEPLFADKVLDKREQVEDLTRRTHERVCLLAGFNKGENIYPPIYSKEIKKIDY